MKPRRQPGFTLAEVATVIITLVVLAAIAIPLWQSHQLRSRREAAVDALLAVQAAQDKHFAAHAFYADQAQTFADPPAGLGVKPSASDGLFTIGVQRSSDQLGYVASAVANAGGETRADARCQQFHLDGHGRRWALDIEGNDSTADCWNRL